jgi:hypothetical protein
MIRKIAQLFIAVLFCWIPAIAQSNIAAGEIRGTVTDASGSVLPESRVSAVNQNGVTFSARTDQNGEYRFLLLPPGIYNVRVEREGFASQLIKDTQITVGQVANIDFQLAAGPVTMVVEVTETVPLVETERVQQSSTFSENWIRQLPIDRRDYLSYALLAPGVADSTALADANDFRVVQAEHSGLSFYGDNGRGNSVKLDGGEMDTAGGGVRPTLSQEAVQEFQINRANYSAELGGAVGGVINIVSKSGTNFFRGTVYDFYRDHRFDAADPFARTLINGRSTRISPVSHRQQYGATLGGPLKLNRTFFFAAFEGLNRNESNSVPVLTDLSIFEPTPEQEAILSRVPEPQAAPLRQLLSAPSSTRSLFEANNGVFPFRSADYKVSSRLDHVLTGSDQLMMRYNFSDIYETNPNTRALVGISRGFQTSKLDHGANVSWTHTFDPRRVNQVRGQFDYYGYLVTTNDKFGPQIDIDGFGLFNRDYTLPSYNILRRSEITDGFTLSAGSHVIKTGGQLLFRNTHSESHALFSGRFSFGPLPGSLVSPALASTTITSLQAFNLGLPQVYQQGFGDPTVSSTDPFVAVYFQDQWKPRPNITLDFGLRYEVDNRRPPVPTDKNNFAPRFGFGWDPGNNQKLIIRGGYGIFYSPQYYFVDWVTTALGDINGHRQIAQVLTTIQTPGAASAANIFRTLRSQGTITSPFPSRSIIPADLQQFGIQVVHDGPIPPLSVLYETADNLVNAYSQQASLGIERSITPNLSIAANYLFARTLKIIRARDNNLLPAPIDPTLGFRVWSTPFFERPSLLQNNLYESSGRAFYDGLTLEIHRRFTGRASFNASYTLSKAIDEVTDFNTDFSANDQTNLRAERALSSFDQRHKFAVYASIQTPRRLGDLTLTPVVRGNSARPFNLLAGFDLNQDRHSTTDRPAFAGRNTGIGPDFWTFDTRVTRKIAVGEHSRLELIAEGFNVFNRLNFRSVNNVVGNMTGPFNVRGRRNLLPSQPLAFTSAFEPRRLQFGIRLSF